MQWFRFYSEFRCDPKLSLMTPHHQWAFIILLCLASDNSERGRIDNLTDEEIAYQIRMPVEDWQTLKAKFKVKGMIDWDETGIKITHWARRQFESDNSTERVRKHREQKRLATATTKETGVKRFSNVNATPPDTDTDPDSDPEIVKNLLESSIPKCPEPNIEPLCSADALRDRAPISKTKEPEPAKQETADTFPPLDSQVEKPGAQPKPRTRKKSGGSARKISTPKNHPEQFDAAWDSYRKFCIAVESTVALSQARKEAVREWDKLIEGGDALEAILDGLNFYMEVKRVEHQRKGEAFGISHFCRFLSNRKWEAAIAYREQKRSQPAPAKDITANVHADLQDITVLLRQLGRSAVLPPEWQERTGKTFTRQLDAVESDDYVAYLKGELERLAVANP
jgi:hypothetical protein